MHIRIQGGIVLSQGALFCVHVFMSVQCLVCVHDMAAFCLAILSPFRNLFLDMDSRCGHVSSRSHKSSLEVHFHAL